MQSSVTTLASLLERTFPAGLSGLIFDCDGVMVDSRDVNIGYYNLLLREVGKPPITPEQAGYVQMSTAKEALEYIFSPEELKLLPAIAERYPYRDVALPQLELEPGLADMLHWLRERGVRLGIHTNRGSGMWDLLARFNLCEMFDPVMTGSNISHRLKRANKSHMPLPRFVWIPSRTPRSRNQCSISASPGSSSNCGNATSRYG